MARTAAILSNYTTHVYNAGMSKEHSFSLAASGRRPSQLGDHLTQEKLSNAQRLPAEARLLLALELSDACLEFQRTCSKTP